ncbi:MAG TPA: UrcA family protein [Rhizomicrobium sp.]|nr:UrcA family protein [Rhizomicrobium sp.]
MTSLHPKHLMLTVLMLASTGLATAPASAQPAKARWTPRMESIVVRAGAPKDWHMALTASHLGKAFAVSATIPVPYADLDLVKEEDAAELGRRVQVAARLVCQQLDTKYPPTQFPILEGYSGPDCVRVTARDSMEQANMVIASAKH